MESSPNHWKLGLFYYNKDDDRAIVPKRIPWMGYTINFAHRGAIVTLVIMIMFFLFVAMMIENHRVN